MTAPDDVTDAQPRVRPDRATRHVLVAGGSRGIGLAVATAALARGDDVLVVSRTPPPDRRLRHLAADLTLVDAPERVAAHARAMLGGIDVLVNCVGGGGELRGGFAAHDDNDWADAVVLNLLAPVRLLRAVLPALRASRGVAINVSSVNATEPDPRNLPYCAAKAALDVVTRSVAAELAAAGVRVVGVAPGPTATEAWTGPDGVAATLARAHGGTAEQVLEQAARSVPLGRFIEPAEVADLVLWLAANRIVTGTTYVIDGGLSAR